MWQKPKGSRNATSSKSFLFDLQTIVSKKPSKKLVPKYQLRLPGRDQRDRKVPVSFCSVSVDFPSHSNSLPKSLHSLGLILKAL